MFRRVYEVAIREFKATAFTKAFVIGTFVLPVVIWGVLLAAGAAGLFNPTQPPVVGVVAIIDQTERGAVSEVLAERFAPERLRLDREREIERIKEELARTTDGLLPEQATTQAMASVESRLGPVPEVTIEKAPAGADWDALRDRVRAGELLAAVRVDEDSITPPGRYDVATGGDAKRQVIQKIEQSVADSIIDARFRDAAFDRSEVETLLRRPSAKAVTMTATGETRGGGMAQIIVPMGAVFLLVMAIFIGASYLLMSTVEEKNSRVMEVLLSAISPMELMTGKIVGQGLVGLTIIIIYGGLSVIAAVQFGLMSFVSPIMLALLVVYFLIGYFMYAALMAAIGAAVTEIREAQSLQGPVFGVVILLIYLGVFAGVNDTNNTLARVLSYVPPVTPFVMSMRIGNPAAPPPAWEIAATIGIGIVSVIVMVWAAAKVFRVGVLMYGKPPSLLGLVKWIRYA
jgi:ABC-2 type transport system permease protein